MARTRPYLLPQVLIQQDFASLPASAIQELIAVIVGPQKLVRDVNDPKDVELVSYGALNTEADATYTLKGVDDLDAVEKDSVSVHLQDVYAQYAQLSGTNQVVRGATQSVLSITAANGLVEHLDENGDVAYARNAVFGNRDVKVGDGVVVIHNGNKTVSRIVELQRDSVESSAENAVADSNNVTSQADFDVISSNNQSTNHSIAADVSNDYLGDLASGITSDTYTVECTTGGSVSAARFKVTSSTGELETDVALVSVSASEAKLAIGTRGAVAKFVSSNAPTALASFVVGEIYVLGVSTDFAQTLPTLVDEGSYEGLFDTTYEVQVVKGGAWADSPQVVVSTNNGVDYSSPQIVEVETPFFLGGLGLQAEFGASAGLRLGDIFYIKVSAPTKGATKTIKLADPLPSTVLENSVITVQFCFRTPSIAIPQSGYPTIGVTNWSLSTDGTLLTLESDQYVGDEYYVGEGFASPLPIRKANVMIGYKALQLANANRINIISEISAIESQIGKVTPENPVAYGVLKALQNSGGTRVFYVPVDEDSVDGYNRAFDATLYEPSAYYITPVSNDNQVIQAAKAHVLAASDPEKARERVAIVSNSFSEIVTKYGKKVDGTSWSGMVSIAPGSSPAVYNRVTVPGATFLADGIRAGDVFRSNFSVNTLGEETYQSFRIVSVTDEENLVLETPAFAAPVGSVDNLRKIQIVRVLARTEQAEKIQAQSEALGSRRVVNVWPDFLQDGDRYVPGYFAAAAVAGLKSGVAPHQPLTNVLINGFSKADRSTPYFSLPQLNIIANGGTWIIDQDRNEGAIYNRHQLTTDYTDDNMAEISITTNLDAISKILREDLRVFIGQYNNHPYFIELMRTRLIDRLAFLQSNAVTLKAGPQLIDYEVVELRTDPLIRTRVLATINLTLPYPVNVIQVKLNVV